MVQKTRALLQGTALKEVVQVYKIIEDYIRNKVLAKRLELQIKEDLEQNGIEFNEVDAGAHIFNLRTGKNPKSKILARVHEAYWICEFENEQDRLQFEAGRKDLKDSKITGATYQHRIIPSLGISILAMSKEDSEAKSKVYSHERQHFINHSVFDFFHDVESHDYNSRTLALPSLVEALKDSDQNQRIRLALRAIKDEMMAYIRDRNFNIDFLKEDLYANLLESFSEDQKVEVLLLMGEIKRQLSCLGFLSRTNDAAAFLVYQLLDVPLTRMDQRLGQLRSFYEKQYGFLFSKIPPAPEEEDFKDQDIYQGALGFII